MNIAKMKQVAVVGTQIMLSFNIALTGYEYVAWRGIHPYLGISLLFLLVMGAGLVAAHVYVNVFEMYKTHKMADAVYYNPYAVYAFPPFQEMWFRTVYIPLLKAARDQAGDEERRVELSEKIAMAEKWVELGYIPRDHFPEHLQKYYHTKHEERL